jgi:SAM-dependent methyltransferase
MKRTWKIKQIDQKIIPAPDQELYQQVAQGQEGYVSFYEKRQDEIIRRDPQTFEKANRSWQIDFMRKQGLKESDRVLDYGCGPAAAGIFFIEFLDPGKWVGVDISKESIGVGEELIERKGLASKKPELIHIPGGGLEPLGGRSFDVILAQSVFTHLPPDEIITILQRLRAHLAPGAAFYASFSCNKTGIVQQQLHNWYYDREFMQIAAEDAQMSVEFLADWWHPYQHTLPSFAVSAMARFRLVPDQPAR